jgi:hypothetical protein
VEVRNFPSIFPNTVKKKEKIFQELFGVGRYIEFLKPKNFCQKGKKNKVFVCGPEIADFSTFC